MSKFMSIFSLSRIIFVFALIYSGIHMEGHGSPIRPIIDNITSAQPKKFRTSHDHVSTRLNIKGLRELNISGSGQFSQESLLKALDELPVQSSQVIIVDLRQESHIFINTCAVSWTDSIYNHANEGKQLSEIEADEHMRLTKVNEEGKIQLSKKDNYQSEEWVIQLLQTERQLAESLGLRYIRLPVADHCRPSNEVVDLFIQNIRSISGDKWLYFHCRGGSGRATTFMVLYDIMMNSKEVSLKDILKRQHALGGKDLTSMDPNNNKYHMAVDRLEFIEKFYEYCRQNSWNTLLWSEWLKNQSIDGCE